MTWHLFHGYVAVEDADHSKCGDCFRRPVDISPELRGRYPKGYCPHSIKVCKCGTWKGHGSHGELTVIPTTCWPQVQKMIEEV